MNLQEFVSESLNQITEGVASAKKNHGDYVAPELSGGDDRPKGQLVTMGWKPAFLVEFDVAVTASESSSAGGGGGLKVLSVVSLEGGGKRSIENSSVSRVKFSVPIVY
jgi:hypothetical protein